MSNRFSRSPDPRNDLFSSYNRSASPSKSKNKARSPYGAGAGAGYGYSPSGSADYLGPGSGGGGGFAAYPGAAGNGAYGPYGGGGVGGAGASQAGFRSATPNSRGQYSAQALDEMESQTEENFGVLTGKVRMLKDLTVAIGDEIRTSTTLADKMNDEFENSRLRLKGTMNRMLRMAEKTGVGWRVWLGFFAAVAVLFWWVWLF